MTVITSDLVGYEAFWSLWIRRGLVVIGSELVVIIVLLYLIWRK